MPKKISEKGNQNHNFIIRLCVRRQDSSTQCAFERAQKMTVGRKVRKCASVEEKVNRRNDPKREHSKVLWIGSLQKAIQFQPRDSAQTDEIILTFNEKASWQIFLKHR